MPVEHRDDQFENRLGAALRNAGDAFDADRAALVAGGENRGRRLRMRRRTAIVSGAAAIALVGVGGALVAPWGGDGTGQRAVGAGGTTVGPGDAGSAPTPTATGAPSPVTGAQLLSKLKELLPQGELRDERARGTDAKLGPHAYGVFDDGKGDAALSISLGRVEPGGQQAREIAECPDQAFVPYDDCVATALPGGALLRIVKGYEYPDRRVDTKLWTADLVTAEGEHVAVMEWNAAAEKGAPISRPEPPLDSAQLKALVTDPAWLGAVRVIPEATEVETPPTSSAPAEVESDAIVTTLTGLLPKGLGVVGQSGPGTEYGYVVVDDGEGKSFVQINVQPNMQDVEDELFGPGSGAVTMPDGVKVVVRQGPGDDKGRGLVMRTADAIWPDGLRVVVSAFNSADQITGPTRENPALTLDQLRTIATDSKWQGLQPVPN
ncbi:hypothetical protein GCM10023084_23470 [Streptomyces lacrimifluminis]|uniref:LigA protein n=1 Tax=Streptomyces lacrimifluminis TaxID=1500077 RepID=A0A917L9X6_9ACTN|nr:hypothetical protein [Streptomyces lacrimifluminis]GGJ52643.1 hypothetical protein GCM10012282_57020 [Streptomyces lacrimifluminis]